MLTRRILHNTSQGVYFTTRHKACTSQHVTRRILHNTSQGVYFTTRHKVHTSQHVTRRILHNTSQGVYFTTRHKAYTSQHVTRRILHNSSHASRILCKSKTLLHNVRLYFHKKMDQFLLYIRQMHCTSLNKINIFTIEFLQIQAHSRNCKIKSCEN